MKKAIVLGAASLFLLTGCGDKVVCTGKVDESGVKADMKIVATFKKDKISNATAEMKFADKKSADKICSLFETMNNFAEKDEDKLDVKCKGKTLKIANYTKLADEDEIKNMTKDSFIKEMEQTDGVKCK